MFFLTSSLHSSLWKLTLTQLIVLKLVCTKAGAQAIQLLAGSHWPKQQSMASYAALTQRTLGGCQNNYSYFHLKLPRNIFKSKTTQLSPELEKHLSNDKGNCPVNSARRAKLVLS